MLKLLLGRSEATVLHDAPYGHGKAEVRRHEHCGCSHGDSMEENVLFSVETLIQKAHPAVAVFPVQDAGAGSPDSFGISGACETPAE